MTFNLTKAEFHELIMVYTTELARENGGVINEESIIFSPLFDVYLKTLYESSVNTNGVLYSKSDSKVRMMYNQMKRSMENVDNVKVML